ncbi:DUF6146 family protein [Flavobacterium psychrophilum]|uniref:DUF6146 family protein n=1 Tax=Flavobacterium psychrophilum TaxID=96345 RepID=UPI00106C7D3C|nr:DUF6146 family protein [Flavobacterium psychrophilum]
MKHFLFFVLILACLLSCKTTNTTVTNTSSPIKGDTIKIANYALEYEVTIVDPGFSSWLNTRAFPRNYYSESYLESKNKMYISQWNNRNSQPMRYDSSLYEMQINYDYTVHYGYEVNYLIYNYMIYFQNTYKQQLFGFVPPR